MNLVLIGYRGSGKSAVGQALAERLGWPFLDTDTLIQQQAGRTIREIYADQGEPVFREFESRIVADVARRDRHIIGTGGGVILRSSNVSALKANGRLIWLAANPEVLWGRILTDPIRRTTRPSPNLTTGLQQIRDALRERDPLYRQAADLTVDTTTRPIPEIVEDILRFFPQT